MTNGKQESLTNYIEQHERGWGMEQYPGKPKLDAILKSPIVVFWRAVDGKEPRWTITLHQDLEDLEKYFARLIFRSTVDSSTKNVVKIFKDGKQVVVRGVKIQFQDVESP